MKPGNLESISNELFQAWIWKRAIRHRPAGHGHKLLLLEHQQPAV
jgi:hypothetical protein